MLMGPLLPDNLDFSRHRCALHESSIAGARSIVIDNGIFSLSILPEFGGRICSLFYRPLNLELLATEFLGGPRDSLLVRGGWCAAFPSLLADGEIISHAQWTVGDVALSDEKVAVQLHCTVERVSHMIEGKVRLTPGTIFVERFVRLKAGESSIIVEDVLTNRNAWPMSTTWAGAITLRAAPGDHVITPVEHVQILQGVGPTSGEIDFGLLMTTPYQALASPLREGWLGMRPSGAPVDLRFSFPADRLPHASVIGQRKGGRVAEDYFRLQPMATAGPIAQDTRDGALILPTRQPVSLPVRLDVGKGIISPGAWSRPGLQLAELITAQRVPIGRVACWRVGDTTIALKTHHHLVLLMPEYVEDSLLTTDDLPAADIILFSRTPDDPGVLRRLAQRTAARIIGPPQIRGKLLAEGVGEDRSIALSPGARVDIPGLGILAVPARGPHTGEALGYLIQADHVSIYHAGVTEFLGEFGVLGQQFQPQLVFLPLAEMSPADAVHAAKQLQPRVVIPLGSEDADLDFVQRCRAQHQLFSANALLSAEGILFDGWHIHPLDD